jgi:hypothetical protein
MRPSGNNATTIPFFVVAARDMGQPNRKARWKRLFTLRTESKTGGDKKTEQRSVSVLYPISTGTFARALPIKLIAVVRLD